MSRGRLDRYNLEKARDPGQLGDAPTHAIRIGNIAIDRVAVPDPQGPTSDRSRRKADDRVMATVNRRVDILEHERAHGRISNEAYLEGRVLQALFERAGLSGGSTWNDGSRVDAEVAKELAVLRKVSNGRAFEFKIQQLQDLLGRRDSRIVLEVLRDNRTYAQVTQTIDVAIAAGSGRQVEWEPYGEGGQRKIVRHRPSAKEVSTRRINYIAQRFRDALETLATEQRRKG